MPTLAPGVRLLQWCSAAGLPLAAVARRLGVTAAAVEHWCRGRRLPSGRHAAAIERLTGGAIPAAVWYAEAAA